MENRKRFASREPFTQVISSPRCSAASRRHNTWRSRSAQNSPHNLASHRHRSKSGSRTGDPSSRNFTKMARFPWSTVRTPATPWPATLLHHRLFGTIARTRARSTGARSPSHPSVLHPHTWKITVITGIRRGHIYSIQCTTRDHHRAWGPCINRH